MPSISERAGETNSITTSALSSASINSPFGLPLDPRELKGKTLTTPFNLLLSTNYLLSNKIFNYKLPGQFQESENIDNILNLWTNLQRKNLNNQVPDIHNIDIRSGCGNVLFGYLNQAKEDEHISVVLNNAAFTFMEPVLLKYHSTYQSLPISFQVAAVDYDSEESKLVSTYAAALSVARNLKLPVLTSHNATEAQHLSIVSSVLAQLNVANVHIFDGLSAIKTNQTIASVLPSANIKKISEQLYAALNGVIQNVQSTNKISFALSELNKILGTRYQPFEYFGDKEADTVFVVYSTSEYTNNLAKQIPRVNEKVGVIVTRVPLPFESSKFNQLISSKAKKIVVLAESLNGANSLKLDVQASLFFEGVFVDVTDASYPTGSDFGITELEHLLAQNVIASPASSSGSFFRFLANDNSRYVDVPSKITHALSLVPDLNIKYRPRFDNSLHAGLFQVDLQVGNVIGNSLDLVIVEDATILNKLNVLKDLKPSGSILVLNDVEEKFDEEKFVNKTLSTKTKQLLASKKFDLKLLDLNVFGDEEATKGRTSSIAIQVAFWKLAYPELDVGAVVTKILQAFGSEAELLAAVITEQVEKIQEVGIKEIKHSEEWSKLELTEQEAGEEYVEFKETSFKPNPREEFIDETIVKVEKSNEVTKKLMFKEAYGVDTALRPDLPIQNFVVKVKENKRLTPSDYSRNIFHIEFDVTGTGCKYNIGEALGIHGRNNPELVDQFIEMYGLNPDDLVEVVSKENDSVFEIRTLRQSLIENIDLLGKPPKRFYESLAEFTKDETEKNKLIELVSPAGAELLKNFQEEKFYCYIDIFEIFKSARPSAQDLVQIIPPLKRREYSIASSQKLHPNEIHLLIVVVDWIDHKGNKRYGQCSKYLSDLRVGQELVVSVKPSILQLPPLATQPIIMAGLGTGLAPFKAFLEERQYQLEQGQEIGEAYLYLGSRHKREEYLYGEYWESFMAGGVLTHLGAAFSRDQPEKVYIQDKIRENIVDLTDLIAKKNGHFYLCGPTWPVPDITACLEDVLENDANERGVKIDSAKEVEEMKEDGRYVLEVY